jgi:hypothetical protein
MAVASKRFAQRDASRFIMGPMEKKERKAKVKSVLAYLRFS